MKKQDKDLIREIVSDRIQSGEIQNMSDWNLKKIVSDMVKEDLISNSTSDSS